MDEQNKDKKIAFRIKPGTKFEHVTAESRAIAAHREANMRIFRLFVLLFVIVVIVAMMMSVVSYMEECVEKKRSYQTRQAEYQKILDKMDSGNQNSRYLRECNLLEQIIFLEEKLLPVTPVKKQAEIRRKIREASSWINDKKERPWLPENLTQNANFICPHAMLDMVFIPAGTFRMGGSRDNEIPVHQVTISKPFWMAKTEVTNRQMKALIPGFDAGEWNSFHLNLPDQPAVRVRWDQAVMYCTKLTELERSQGRLPAGYVYRLPTEAEWEYACRAGTSTDFYWGTSFGNPGAAYANALDKTAAERFSWALKPVADAADKDGHLVSAPVSSFQPNAFGLCDMSGNAAEWCQDWYDPHGYTKDAVTDPAKLTPVNVNYTRFRNFDAGTWTTQTACRVIRGGSWGVEPLKVRSAYRDFMPPNEGNTGVGFRPVLAHEL